MTEYENLREQIQQAYANAFAVGVCIDVRWKIPNPDADVTITYGVKQ